jgi:hypothetical protein
MNEEKISKTALSYSSPAKKLGAGSPRICRRDTHGLGDGSPQLPRPRKIPKKCKIKAKKTAKKEMTGHYEGRTRDLGVISTTL